MLVFALLIAPPILFLFINESQINTTAWRTLNQFFTVLITIT